MKAYKGEIRRGVWKDEERFMKVLLGFYEVQMIGDSPKRNNQDFFHENFSNNEKEEDNTFSCNHQLETNWMKSILKQFR